ncbi:hypothetical protein [Alkalispirochaeta americana]|uniref:hypothetical protein n=1 Tax=Alkalispirochaeta americana TaxID=159291 RepID=UPI000970E9ED|nr:hypothetical protein [Alkalispirochaeta americana]
MISVDNYHYLHAYAVRADGSVWAWGMNNRLGTLARDPKTWRAPREYFAGLESYIEPGGPVENLNGTPYPIEVFKPDGSSFDDAVQVVTHTGTTLVLTSGGEIWGWGYPARVWPWPDLQAGDNIFGKSEKYYQPVMSVVSEVAAPAKITRLDIAQTFAAGMADDGTVFTWGWNNIASLGHGEMETTNPPGRIRDTRDMRDFPEDSWPWISEGRYLQNVKEVALVDNGTLILKEDGRVFYQGTHYTGDGRYVSTEKMRQTIITPENVPVLNPVLRRDGTQFDNIAAITSDRGYRMYMLDEDGVFWHWGRDIESRSQDSYYGLYPERLPFARFDKDLNEWVEIHPR